MENYWCKDIIWFAPKVAPEFIAQVEEVMKRYDVSLKQMDDKPAERKKLAEILQTVPNLKGRYGIERLNWDGMAKAAMEEILKVVDSIPHHEGAWIHKSALKTALERLL